MVEADRKSKREIGYSQIQKAKGKRAMIESRVSFSFSMSRALRNST